MGRPPKLGLQVHLRHDRLDYQARSLGAIYDVAAPKSLANFGSGEWNRCEILCDWPRLQVMLNGVKVQDLAMATNPSLRYRLRKGFIGLREHWRPRLLQKHCHQTSSGAGRVDLLVFKVP